MSVATPELRFGQAIQSERSGKTACPRPSTCSSNVRRVGDEEHDDLGRLRVASERGAGRQRRDQLAGVSGVVDDADDVALPDTQLLRQRGAGVSSVGGHRRGG